MKKKIIIIISILFLLGVLLFIFKINNNTNSDISTNFDDDYLLAVAVLKDTTDYLEYLDKDNIKVIDYSKENIFLIVPRYKNMNIDIYNTKLENDDLVKDKLISNTKDSFIIKCNESDIMPNIMIVINYKDKEYEYMPFISLKDGKLSTDPIIKDITKY